MGRGGRRDRCRGSPLLNAALKPGADLILEKLNFSLGNADLVIVGEGCIDGQTAHHKAPFEVARLAKSKNIPVIAIVRSLGAGYDRCGIDAIMPLSFIICPIPSHTAALIAEATEQALRFIAIPFAKPAPSESSPH